MTFLLTGYLAMSEGALTVTIQQEWGCFWHLVVETKDADRQPAMPRIAPRKKIIDPRMSVMQRLEIPETSFVKWDHRDVFFCYEEYG